MTYARDRNAESKAGVGLIKMVQLARLLGALSSPRSVGQGFMACTLLSSRLM